MCSDLRFGFLRLSTIKKCPQMLRSDHRGLRNSKVKLMWVGGGGGGGWVYRAKTNTALAQMRLRWELRRACQLAFKCWLNPAGSAFEYINEPRLELKLLDMLGRLYFVLYWYIKLELSRYKVIICKMKSQLIIVGPAFWDVIMSSISSYWILIQFYENRNQQTFQLTHCWSEETDEKLLVSFSSSSNK